MSVFMCIYRHMWIWFGISFLDAIRFGVILSLRNPLESLGSIPHG